MPLMADCGSTGKSVSRVARGRACGCPGFREGVNVLFTGTEEIQKVHAHVFAGLTKAQQNK